MRLSSSPLTPFRIIPLALVLMMTGNTTVRAQSHSSAQIQVSEPEQPMAKDAHPAFLVATIKPSDPGATGGWAFPNEGRHITCINATVATIMTVAYGIHIKQIADAPGLAEQGSLRHRRSSRCARHTQPSADAADVSKAARRKIPSGLPARDPPDPGLRHHHRKRRAAPEDRRTQRRTQYRELRQQRTANLEVHQHIHVRLRAQYEPLRRQAGHRPNRAPRPIRLHPQVDLRHF